MIRADFLLKNARDMFFNPVSKATVAKINKLVNELNQENWDECHGLVIGSDGMTTLWEAVIRIDPTFPTSKALDESWEKVPDTETVIKAIKTATAPMEGQLYIDFKKADEIELEDY